MTKFKKYGEDTQKAKVIKIMMLKGSDSWFEDFECEKYTRWFGEDIYVGNSNGSRMSELKNDGVLEVQKFENPNALHPGMGKRARYRLTDEAVAFYSELYNI